MKRKGRNRVFIYSFFLTLLVLAVGAVAASYLSSQPVIQHLPSNFDLKEAAWMRYIPSDAEKISIMNFSQVVGATGNSSLFPTDRLLVIFDFETELRIPDVEFAVTALYRNPDPNADDIALNILRPNQESYEALSKELEEEGELTFPLNGHTVIQVTGRIVSKPVLPPKPTPVFVKGYAAVEQGLVLYAEGSRGLDIVRRALLAADETNPFFSQRDVKASLYLLFSQSKGELGFSYSTLPYPVNAVNAFSTSVRYEQGAVITKYVFVFNDLETATKSLSDIKQANLEATYFQIVDNYIVVISTYESDLLLRELRSL